MSVMRLNLLKKKLFAGIYIRTMQFTWLETRMSLAITDKLRIPLALVTDLLTIHIQIAHFDHKSTLSGDS